MCAVSTIDPRQFRLLLLRDRVVEVYVLPRVAGCRAPRRQVRRLRCCDSGCRSACVALITTGTDHRVRDCRLRLAVVSSTRRCGDDRSTGCCRRTMLGQINCLHVRGLGLLSVDSLPRPLFVLLCSPRRKPRGRAAWRCVVERESRGSRVQLGRVCNRGRAGAGGGSLQLVHLLTFPRSAQIHAVLLKLALPRVQDIRV
jgi:hypothetical protein